MRCERSKRPDGSKDCEKASGGEMATFFAVPEEAFTLVSSTPKARVLRSAEPERVAAPIEANSNGITEGRSNGWRLIYCKSPEGKQREFVQPLGSVKRIFDAAREVRRSDEA
jgi:hypothetical protein